MSQLIMIAGATGNLGGKIVDALVAKGAKVGALVRLQSNQEAVLELKAKGVHIYEVNMSDKMEIAKNLANVGCLVSALAGLEDVILDNQKTLLDAAIIAGVPRFIPSDFSLDFTNLIPGKNRNLDMRRSFHSYIDAAPISATTIFNGPFTELLTGDMPMILFKIRRILCWGNADLKLDFTTIDDVAKFTAFTAMDTSSPRYLKIAGDRISCRDLASITGELTGKKFGLLKPGGINLLELLIKITKKLSPEEGELYPSWQGMQYMRDMMEGKAIIDKYDNLRYPDVTWTSVRKFLISENIKNRYE